MGVVVTACGATPGAKPHDMSAAGHEAAARSEERAAGDLAAQYDAGALHDKRDCNPKLPCWTSHRVPTAADLDMVEAHRRAAGEHRAATRALEEAEARACAGLPPTERDVSPFAHREDLASAAPLTEAVVTGKVATQRTVGAIIRVRAVPGLTAEWLQRTVDCHLARASALGHEVPEMSYCPLVPKGATAQVTSAGDGFDVRVRSSDPAAAHEILQRALRLVGRAAP